MALVVVSVASVVSVDLGWVSVVVAVVARGLSATSECPNDCPRCHWSCYAAVYHVPPANCDLAPESERTMPSDVVSQTRAMAVTQSKYFSRLGANDSESKIVLKGWFYFYVISNKIQMATKVRCLQV